MKRKYLTALIVFLLSAILFSAGRAFAIPASQMTKRSSIAFILPWLAENTPQPELVQAPPGVDASSSRPRLLGDVIETASWGEERGNQVAFSPDGELLAVASSTGIYIYDAVTSEQVNYLPSEMWVRSLAFSPDGELLAGASYDCNVRIWRVADGVLLRTLEDHTDWVRSVAFSPDGATLASAANDDSIRLWNVTDGTLAYTLQDNTEGVRTIAFSGDGKLLAAGLRDGTVSVWRTSDWTLQQNLKGHTDWVRSVAFSPDGEMLASGAFDKTARLWRLADGELLQTLKGHTASVLSVAFSPDGKMLATGSVDTNVHLWRVIDGALLRRLEDHSNFVFSVDFSPDGKRVSSTAMDNSVRIWDVSNVGSSTATPVATPAPEATAGEEPGCERCHHPRGAYQPALVIDTSCDQCHEEGASLEWDPDIPRDPNPFPANTDY